MDTTRDGSQYLSQLRASAREVWIEGERAEDVVTDPRFAGSAASIAAVYDLQRSPEHRTLLTREVDDTTLGFSHVLPRSTAELAAQRDAVALVARQSFGMMGRTPDFVNIAVAALAQGSDFFGEPDRDLGQNVLDFAARVRTGDLFLTHALVSPQTDRSRAQSEQHDDLLHLGVVRETDAGLVVRGARMLATLAPVADEVLIYSLPGLRPGDERHALAFALPLSTPGLRLICRPPFRSCEGSDYDHPLSRRFDEPDALVVFDDVLVPWSRVFMHGSVARSNHMYDAVGLGPHLSFQTGVRGLVKLQFVAGLCAALASSIKVDGFLNVQQMLASAVMAVDIAESLIDRSIAGASTTSSGVVVPAYQPLRTLRQYTGAVYPQIVHDLQTMGAGGLLMMPTAADFSSPIGEDVARYYQGAEGLPAEERVRLFKLAWEVCGDGFGQRQLQYERYYGGDPVRVAGQLYRSFDLADCRELVDRALELAGKPV
ncbi:4-hydroxyphenylacetate 3-monooxygenase, oxygenase component [Nocardioides hungaricus]